MHRDNSKEGYGYGYGSESEYEVSQDELYYSYRILVLLVSQSASLSLDLLHFFTGLPSWEMGSILIKEVHRCDTLGVLQDW